MIQGGSYTGEANLARNGCNHLLANVITMTMDTKRTPKTPANLTPKVPGILTRPL